MKKYFGLFSSYEKMVEEFGYAGYAYDEDGNFRKSKVKPPSGMPPKSDILIACYEYESYSGSCFVLFQTADKLYLVSGGHCSCNGLEGQWDPSPTTWEALAKWNFDHHVYSTEAEETMRKLIAKNLKN